GLALMALETLDGEKRRQALEEPEVRSLIDMVVSDPELTTGRRQRHLDAASVVFICLAMALFRGVSLVQLAGMLGLKGDRGRRLASSSITEARQRVGAAPVRALFETMGMLWSHEAAELELWRGLKLYAFDGTTLTVQDSDANFEHFGKPASRSGDAGYPKLRLVALLAVRSRLLVDANFGPYCGKGTGESTLAAGLWDGVPDSSVLLFDRLFFDTRRLANYLSTGTSRHFVTRECKKLSYSVLEILDNGDELIEVRVSDAARKQQPELPETFLARRIAYQFAGHPPSALITSLIDPVAFPAKELLDIYHERWSIELVYRDLKTTQMLRLECLRSKTPQGVEQEVWGLLAAYVLIRKRMFDVAVREKLTPARLSFKTTLIGMQAFLNMMGMLDHPPHLVRAGLDMLDWAIINGQLPPPAKRAYPRHVKVKMSSYKRNRGRREGPT
ncbi:MAG: IS4 family transposase, partial [Cryomorphaceae bacterium]|nr:IS4 family transposase [Cryomorphaceae bacterium]